MSKDWMTLFIEFNKCNPHVYDLFKKFTLEVIDAGHPNYGGKAIYNRIRWHCDIETSEPPMDDEKLELMAASYKLNDAHIGFYCRMFEWEFPLLEGFFKRRKSFLYEEEFTHWLKQRFEDEPTLVTTS